MAKTYGLKKSIVFKCILLVVSIVILILIGRFVFNLNRPTPRNVEILIGGGGGSVTLLEVNNDAARVTVFRGSRWFYDDFLAGDISHFAYEITHQYDLELSQEQLDRVLALARNVVRGRQNRASRWILISGHIDYAWAIIDGRRYWSLYHSDIDNASRERQRTINRHINRDLLYLIYELVDVSPIPLYGSDNWPLRPS